jgi:beta-glucanase (GH16 family)
MGLLKTIKPVWLLTSLSMTFGVRADCECGYSMTTGHGNDRHIFTDMIENDFVHLDIMAADTQYGQYGWAAQVFDKTKEEARGPYGETYTRDQVVSNNIEDNNVSQGPGKVGPDAGLQLVVGSQLENNLVPNAEIATTELNYHYGTFRAGIKVTGVSGTCSAFFWVCIHAAARRALRPEMLTTQQYFNDTQEIDIEFLSAQFNPDNSTFPVNLVLQSREASSAGFDASGTKDFKTINLPFDPTAAFHEYRFDYLTDMVIFYADGTELARMEGASVPTEAGHVLLSHWSNGNRGWSGGPPTEDAVTTISYVKSYFNSSLETRQDDFAKRCTDPAATRAVCDIPNNDPSFFFSHQENSTPNQTIYNHANGGIQASASWRYLAVALVMSSVLAVGL